jgi:hypothetical protein
MSPMTRRLQWLFPVEREVYRTWRTCFLGTPGVTPPDCIRCGSQVRMGEVGFATRVRGSRFKKTQSHYIHRRCVPTAEFTGAGVPANRARGRA